MSSEIVVHFAHANGFPAQSYRKLFTSLGSDIKVLAKPQFAHDQRFPVTNNWQYLVDELIDYVCEHSPNTPVFAVGHSFGGVISYMAVCKRPELFRGLILLDPALITGWRRVLFKCIKGTQLIDKFTPSGMARIRKHKWQKEDNVVSYFKGKGLFAKFDHDCIRDYVDAATRLDTDGYNLVFEREIEAKLFTTVPDNLQKFKGRLQTPGYILTAEHSNVCMPSNVNPFIRANNIEHKRLDDVGHMFPFEQPRTVARLIRSKLLEWSE